VTTLNDALALAATGYSVFPCRNDKTPATRHGFKDAASDPAAVRGLWHRYPGALIGIATGAVSDLAVLDLDARHGGAEWWRAHKDGLPITRTIRTRSGGLHLWFRHAPGLRCSASVIAPGIDVRADGGYVIWWPAAGYEVLNPADPAPWPAWVSALLEPPPRPAWTPPKPEPASVTRYADAALDRAARIMAATPEGQRNFTLNRETFCLARKELAIARERLRAVMSAAAAAAGLPQDEIDRTIEAAFKARDAPGGR
jgi:hypothetical protein